MEQLAADYEDSDDQEEVEHHQLDCGGTVVTVQSWFDLLAHLGPRQLPAQLQCLSTGAQGSPSSS